MQILRHHEAAGSPGARRNGWNGYDVLSYSNIRQRFGVKEVNKFSQLPVPPSLKNVKMLDKFLFQRMGSTPSQRPLKTTMEDRWRPTWNGQSLRKVSAQDSFRVYKEERPAKNSAEAWVCGLVPVHQLVAMRSSDGHDSIFFIHRRHLRARSPCMANEAGGAVHTSASVARLRGRYGCISSAVARSRSCPQSCARHSGLQRSTWTHLWTRSAQTCRVDCRCLSSSGSVGMDLPMCRRRC